ncbi:DUF4982 domain-containing protein [Polaribacter marinivivus]|uniref:DUF4982 domain-containing protein n=1 Tax=Polaribacter marinivivus TaxID=1524260 RepID=A0ABV8R4J1_9FLAO
MLKKNYLSLFLLFNIILSFSQNRKVIELSEGWKFQKGNPENASQIEFNDTNWQNVTVPHDWAIYGPFDKEIDKQIIAITQNGEKIPTEKTGRTGSLPHIGSAWYRKSFNIHENDINKKIILQFDGAMSEPEVFLNGKKIGEWKYGYSYFYFDISEDVLKGNNLLAVKLINKEFASRWYPGAGLYRKVTLTFKEKENIKHWGTFITTPIVTKSFAKVSIKTKVSSTHGKLVTKIYDKLENLVAERESSEAFGNEFEQNIKINNPNLWSPENPYLYTAKTSLFIDNKLKDEITTKFGVRKIEFIPKKGFFLNDSLTKFKGVCLHHDLGPLGTAINRSALKRQLTILKDMGVNAIRSSHNMPSLEQLELCDEMGFLFLAESFDEWKKPKVKNGYNRFFDEYAKKDVENLVRATRNHPCIVMWSSGNEVPDQWGSEGVKRAKWLQDIFHKEDPTRPVTVGMDQVKAVMASGFGAIMDIPGLNYRVHLYEEANEKFPQGYILGSETASTVSSRGIYKFPVAQGIMKKYDDFQSSSYDLEFCSWSNLPEDDFILQDDKSWVLGEFVWTGFDYLGEPTPYDEQWPSRSSYFGMIDLAGIPKDRYYLYRSRWNTKEETLHILPHWNWKGREGKKTPVFVYTNYDSAELFVNGKSMGIQKKTKDKTPQHRYRLMWNDVIYKPGTLKVIAFNADGKAVASKEIKTAGKPYQIVLDADRKTVNADGKDISFVTVSVVDKNGVPCPTATNQLQFDVTGKGNFRAVCNGDATSLELFHKPTMKLFSGKLVVLVQSTKETGNITLKVKGKGLKSGSIQITSIKE